MSVTKGKDGRFKVGSVTVAEVRSFRFTQTSNKTDSSTIADTWDKHERTTKSWAGSAEVWWDPSDTTGQGALEAGDTPTVFLYPAGTAAGKTYYTGAVGIDSVEITNTRDGLVEATIQFTGNGELTTGTV